MKQTLILLVLLGTILFTFAFPLRYRKRDTKQASSNPICFGILSDAKFVCSGHGRCTGPNTCVCDSGWEGAHCEKPIGTPNEFPLSKALSIASSIAASVSSRENYTYTTAILRDTDSDSLTIDCNKLCASVTPNFGSHYNNTYGTAYKTQRLTCVGAISFEVEEYDGYSEPIAEQTNFYIVNYDCDAPTYLDQIAFCLCASNNMTYQNHPDRYPPYYVPPQCCNATYVPPVYSPMPYTSAPVYTTAPKTSAPVYTTAPTTSAPVYTTAPKSSSPTYTSAPPPKTSTYYPPP